LEGNGEGLIANLIDTMNSEAFGLSIHRFHVTSGNKPETQDQAPAALGHDCCYNCGFKRIVL
jgi:hypothetical protein